MKILFKTILMSIPLSIAVACSETDTPSQTEPCPEEKFLEQVYSRLYGNSRSAKPFEITDLSTKTYEIVNDSAIEVFPTRSEIPNNPRFSVKTADAAVASVICLPSLSRSVFR